MVGKFAERFSLDFLRRRHEGRARVEEIAEKPNTPACKLLPFASFLAGLGPDSC